MHSMYECYHYDGEFVNLSDDDKIDVINSLFKSTKKDILDLIAPHLEKLYNLIETPARKSLREWSNKMGERSKFIKDTPYSPDYEDEVVIGTQVKTVTIKGTHKMLDDMMKATEDIWDSYWKIQEKLNQEKSKSTGESGAELSLKNKGLI